MKRDLIYLTLIVSAIWAAHATAKAVQDGPQQIEPRKIEAGFTKTVHILFPSPVTYIDIGSMDIIAGKADGFKALAAIRFAPCEFFACIVDDHACNPSSTCLGGHADTCEHQREKEK